ncbi:16S rRNA (guanine(527)-N(7))-methyltransferase RsmG [Planctomycetota bacterium]
MRLSSLETAALSLGIGLGGAALELFRIYMEEIEAGNQRVNLVSFSSDEELAVRHFADSLACVRYLPTDPICCVDVGSGGGFPGIPVKIVRPDIDMTLVESVGKKTLFLEEAIEKLRLDRTVALQERAETLGRGEEHRERYDAALLRATAPFPVAVEYTLPLVKMGGFAIIFQVSAFDEDALAGFEDVINMLGGTAAGVDAYELGPSAGGAIVRIEKTGPTPPEYPRKPGTPKKNPLKGRSI